MTITVGIIDSVTKNFNLNSFGLPPAASVASCVKPVVIDWANATPLSSR